MRWATTSILALSFVIALAPAAVGAGEQTWKAELSVGNPAPILGEPVYFKITVTNLTDHEVVMPREPKLWGPYCNLEVEPLDPAYRAEFFQHLGRPQGSPVPIVITKHSYSAHAQIVIGWLYVFTPMRTGGYRARYVCDVPDSAVAPDVNPKTKELESNEEVWRGSFASKDVVVRAERPSGVDADAYEALAHGPINMARPNALLTLFPSSTYAAYVVWEKYAQGWAGVDPAEAVALLGRGYAFETGLTWCNSDARPAPGADARLSGSRYVECRNAWLELALSHHPDIWIADEMRLRLAVDHFVLGDRAGTEAKLAILAEHGRPDVATKAGELLAAMRAKGMFEAPAPAAAPDPVAAPVPGSGPVPAPGGAPPHPSP